MSIAKILSRRLLFSDPVIPREGVESILSHYVAVPVRK